MKFMKKVKGFTLIELLLVVGLIAVAGVAAYIAYPKVQAQNRANTEAQAINTIAAGVKNMYASVNNYQGLTMQVAIQGNVIPQSMVNGTAANNSFGGNVTLFPITYNSGNPNNAFKIGYEKVPPAECVKLVTGVGANFQAVYVAPNTAVTATAPTKPGAGAAGSIKDETTTATANPSVSNATAACVNANNTIVFEKL